MEQLATEQPVELVPDVDVNEPMPTLWQGAKFLGGKPTTETCRWPDACGRKRVWGPSERGYRKRRLLFCHRHTCPVSQAGKAREHLRRIQHWPTLWWQEVSDERYHVLWAEIHALDLDAIGIPTPAGMLIVLTPEPLMDAVVYTGGWYSLFQLIANVPEKKRVRHPYHYPTDRTARERTDDCDCEECTEGELKGIPLTPRYEDYALVDWTDAEELYLLDQAGLGVELNTEGSLEIVGDKGEIATVLDSLCHPAEEFVQVTREVVLHELQLAERPAKYRFLNQMGEREPRQTKRTYQWVFTVPETV